MSACGTKRTFAFLAIEQAVNPKRTSAGTRPPRLRPATVYGLAANGWSELTVAT